MNHYGLFIKLMDRMLPANILCVLENWFSICDTRVHWGNEISESFKIECGIRQGGVLSPYLFAIYVDDIVTKLQRTNLGCYIKGTFVGIFLYADDIVLLAPSIESLQKLTYVCETELLWLDMTLNVKKSMCMRIGPRYDIECASLTTLHGDHLSWVNCCRYLGVEFTASRHFKCSFSNAKKSFHRSFNAIFGKVGRLASEEVILQLVSKKCLPVLLYGLEACPLNATDSRSMDFVLNRVLMKIFNTYNNDIINECYCMFNMKTVSELITRR